MKTSTKIFIGVVAVLAAALAADLVRERRLERKYGPLAEAIAQRLDTARIRVVEVDVISGDDTSFTYSPQWFQRGTHNRRANSLHLPAELLDNIDIAGDTLKINDFEYKPDEGILWYMFADLETVIIHRPGKPDYVRKVTSESHSESH